MAFTDRATAKQIGKIAWNFRRQNLRVLLPERIVDGADLRFQDFCEWMEGNLDRAAASEVIGALRAQTFPDPVVAAGMLKKIGYEAEKTTVMTDALETLIKAVKEAEEAHGRAKTALDERKAALLAALRTEKLDTYKGENGTAFIATRRTVKIEDEAAVISFCSANGLPQYFDTRPRLNDRFEKDVRAGVKTNAPGVEVRETSYLIVK